MRKTAFFLMAATLLLSACHYIGGKRVSGNGNLTEQARTINNFTGVVVLGAIDVVLTVGPNYAVKVEADQNLLEFIETHKDGAKLTITTRDGYNLRSRNSIKVYVTSPVYDHVEVAGSGNVTSGSKLTGSGRLDARVDGSGDVRLEVDAPEVRSEITGSGSITLSGNTRNFDAAITGSGDVRCLDLLSERTRIDITGSGNAQVYASKELDIEISGSGTVEYGGDPQTHQEISGSGDVRKIK